MHRSSESDTKLGTLEVYFPVCWLIKRNEKKNILNTADCAYQASTMHFFYVRGKSIIVITTLLLGQTLSSTCNMCICINTSTRNAMLIFSLTARKKETAMSAATVVTNGYSCTSNTFQFSLCQQLKHSKQTLPWYRPRPKRISTRWDWMG